MRRRNGKGRSAPHYDDYTFHIMSFLSPSSYHRAADKGLRTSFARLLDNNDGQMVAATFVRVNAGLEAKTTFSVSPTQ